MKKVLAVMLALVMAFSLCIPSFAETTGAAGGLDFGAIIETISGVISGFLPSDTSMPDMSGIMDTITGIIGGIIGGGGEGSTDTTGGGSELPTYENLTPEQAEQIVNAMLQTGLTKEDVKDAIEEMYATGRLDVVSYENLLKALEKAEDPTTSAPIIDDEDVVAVATQIISTLRKMGVTDDQMKSVVDALYERGTIPQNVYDEIIRQLDSAETTTDASNAGGIGGFLSGIVDTIKGFFGADSGEGGEGGNGTTTNPDSYEGKEPTGDTAILSVAAVAAVAGVALVLTKKKQK